MLVVACCKSIPHGLGGNLDPSKQNVLVVVRQVVHQSAHAVGIGEGRMFAQLRLADDVQCYSNAPYDRVRLSEDAVRLLSDTLKANSPFRRMVRGMGFRAHNAGHRAWATETMRRCLDIVWTEVDFDQFPFNAPTQFKAFYRRVLISLEMLLERLNSMVLPNEAIVAQIMGMRF